MQPAHTGLLQQILPDEGYLFVIHAKALHGVQPARVYLSGKVEV